MRSKEVYTQANRQIEAVIQGENDCIANLANIVSILHAHFGYFWIGFYRVRSGELVLGPFSGPVACTRIALGRGVCGTSWAEKASILVPDVHEFPGHIACNATSASEVVIPVIVDDNVVMVLDVDSDRLDDFDQVDVKGLEDTCRIIAASFPAWSL